MCLFCPKFGFFCPQTPEMLFSFTTKGVEKCPQAFLDPKIKIIFSAVDALCKIFLCAAGGIIDAVP